MYLLKQKASIERTGIQKGWDDGIYFGTCEYVPGRREENATALDWEDDEMSRVANDLSLIHI